MGDPLFYPFASEYPTCVPPVKTEIFLYTGGLFFCVFRHSRQFPAEVEVALMRKKIYEDLAVCQTNL